ncbi:MAG: hypothetical protein ACYCZF_13930 [Anaerolineae bacterium]
MLMVMCVIDNPALLEEVLAEWRNVGVTGATVLTSSGMQRRLSCQLLIPHRYAFEGLTESCSEGHYTLLSIVPDETTANACLLAAEKVVGDFSQPQTGVFTYWPLSFVKGIKEKKTASGVQG